MRQLILIFIFTVNICYAQTTPLSLNKLFAEPLYYLRNDTIFTVDLDNNIVICKDYKTIYRLKIFAGNETGFKEYSNGFKVPYSDITGIMKKINTLPNLQYLDLNFLQLWKFPKEVLSLESVQILKMFAMSADDRTERIYHKDTVPVALWKMKNLKYLTIYAIYDEQKRLYIPYLNEADHSEKTRQYVPNDVKFYVGSYLSVDKDQRKDEEIQNIWKNERKKLQRKIDKKNINSQFYRLERLKSIFGENFWQDCECE